MNISQVFIFCFALLAVVSSTPQNHTASDGREYLIETEQQYNWLQAWHECARRGFQLVAIDTETKNNAVVHLLDNFVEQYLDFWLGGNDEFSTIEDTDRPFFWSATGEQFDFSYWSDDNPDNYDNQENCVHIQASNPLYKWNDIGCTTEMGFICEEKPNLED